MAEANIIDALDTAICKRIREGPVVKVEVEPELEEEVVEDHLNSLFKEQAQGYFKCLVPDCPKMFSSAKFVKNHLRKKHTDKMLSEDDRKERVGSHAQCDLACAVHVLFR